MTKMSDTAEAKYKYEKELSEAEQGATGTSTGRRTPRSHGAVEYPRGKSREEARVSTQLVLNKYSTNYEALGWLTVCISF